MVKTISAPLPVLDPAAPAAQSTVLDAPLPTPPAATPIPAMAVTSELLPTDLPAGAIQKCELPPVVVGQESNMPVGQTAPCAAANVAGNDLGAAFVTVALSINITSNGIYATSRCSSPARVPNNNNASGDQSMGVSTASVPLKLCIAEANAAGSRPAGGNSLPTSQPPTPQTCPTMDTYLMDLQHKLASLSMTNNNPNPSAHLQQQHQNYSPDSTQQLPSPSSSTKEGTPLLEPVVHPSVVVDQVDQATENNRPAQQQQRKVLPSTIDIHDLHSELSKLHSQGPGHPPSLLKAKEALNPCPTEALATVASSAANPVVQPATASNPPEVVDEAPPDKTVIKPIPVSVGPSVTPVASAPTTTKEQKSSQTEPELSVAQQPQQQRKLSLPPPVPPGERRISRFCVSLVDEKQRTAASGLPEEANKDPELRELLLRHEQEKKALIRKHEEELAAFHARRKQQSAVQQQSQPHPLQRQEATEGSRTPSPGASCNPDFGEGRGLPTQNSNATAAANGASGPVPNPTRSSSPGTPTRQTKTFTDDLLRLVQDLGSKPGAEKSKKAGGEGVEKAPTLNQLRAGANGGAAASLQQQQQQQQHHSLTQTAGIFTPPT